MAHVSRFPGLRHYRGGPTSYAVHLVRGRLRHEGAGLAFYFRPRTSALSEVPIDDRELTVMAHARTADFQDVAVPCSVTYRFADPVEIAARLDFAIDPDGGTWSAAGIEQVGHLLTELAQSIVLDVCAALSLADALGVGIAQARDALSNGLTGDPRLTGLGIEVLGVRVLALRPEPDLERALQTPAREQVQADADRATYERRALAVERERAIAENELANEIELATRREALVAQEGANGRLEVSETVAAAKVAAQGDAERALIEARADAEAAELRGRAEADATRALMAAYGEAGPGVLLGLAAREAAANLPEVGSITLTPDLLSRALARFADAEA